MENVLEKIGFVLLGGLITGLGYLLKRRIERKPVFDTIEKHQKLLSLNKELSKQKVSLTDLKKLEDALLIKSKATESYVAQMSEEVDIGKRVNRKLTTYLNELTNSLSEGLITHGEMTQLAELNDTAYQLVLQSDEKLKSMLKLLEEHLDKIQLNDLLEC